MQSLPRLMLALVLFPLAAHLAAASPGRGTPPNIVIIFLDDLGYGDLGCYGHPSIRTPNIDRLAAEGVRFTDFYSAAEVCTPSRAALLTGRYPIRNGMCGKRRVYFPDSTGGLPPGEITIAEILRDRGYATAHIGKWHLGIHEGSRPNDQGFDFSYSIPYSNDMDPRPGLEKGSAKSPEPPHEGWNVPLIRNGEIVERPADQTTITRRFTEETERFIRDNAGAGKPFFVYLAHSMPHVPLFASSDFKGKSPRGIYGDVVEELDWSVGRVIATLREAGVDRNTVVFFTSDNGPWLTQGLQGGSAGLLRDGKGGTWEGGMRVPGIAWGPGRVTPAVSRELACTMDIFATAASMAEAGLPTDRQIDGVDLSGLLADGGELPERPFFYYRGCELAAARLGPHKLHFFTQAGYIQPQPERHDPPILFHLGSDPGESHDISADHPEEISRILAAVDAHRQGIIPVPSNLH